MDEVERSTLAKGLGRAAAAAEECVAALPDVARVVLRLRRKQWRTLQHKISLREVNDGYAELKDSSLNRVVVTSF